MRTMVTRAQATKEPVQQKQAKKSIKKAQSGKNTPPATRGRPPKSPVKANLMTVPKSVTKAAVQIRTSPRLNKALLDQ